LRLVSYRRTSGDKSESTSLESQLQKITAKCVTADHSLVADFVDKESAETAEKREGFMSALNMVYSNQADGLIVWKLDRFARSVSDGVRILRDFKALRKCLVCVADPIDTTTPLGEAFFQIAMVFAELERKTIAERCYSGRVARGQQFRYAGGAAPYGWDASQLGESKILVENKQEQSVIQLIRELRESTTESRQMSYQKIAHELTARKIPVPRPARKIRMDAAWDHTTVRSIYVNESKIANWLAAGQSYNYLSTRT
jgi:site-specific DNA recombinase